MMKTMKLVAVSSMLAFTLGCAHHGKKCGDKAQFDMKKKERCEGKQCDMKKKSCCKGAKKADKKS
jgi:hypothetical protein